MKKLFILFSLCLPSLLSGCGTITDGEIAAQQRYIDLTMAQYRLIEKQLAQEQSNTNNRIAQEEFTKQVGIMSSSGYQMQRFLPQTQNIDQGSQLQEDDGSGYEAQTPAQGQHQGIVIMLNGATINGGNFFSAGSTARPAAASRGNPQTLNQLKRLSMRPIQLPKSNLQTIWDGILGVTKVAGKTTTDIATGVAPWAVAGYLGGLGIRKESTAVSDSNLYGRDNNGGRLQYKYIMNEEGLE